MATVSTPLRQPFGVLNESKLRNLQSIKNRQNAITPNSAPSLKRRAPSPELSDSENIDPHQFDAAIKRKRSAFDDDVSISKQPRLTTNIIPSSMKAYTPTVSTTSTPRKEEVSKPASFTPLSAPAAAGRSPTRLHSRSKLNKLQPRRRFAPPSLGGSPSVSIAAALRGTIAQKKSKPRRSLGLSIGESKPKSWSFDIYEESEAIQDYRMCEWTMTQSSAALDISDDEGKAKSFDGKADDKGKENIDPNAMFAGARPVTRAAAAAAITATSVEESKDKMNTEEPRTPLGDLKAADYYAEGLDATSVVLVHDDVPQEDALAPLEQAGDNNTEPPLASTPVAEAFTFESRRSSPSAEEAQHVAIEDIPAWAQRTSLLFDAEQPRHEDSAMPGPAVEAGDIDIWESESAKDENEQQPENEESNVVVIGEGQTISLSGGCLRDI